MVAQRGHPEEPWTVEYYETEMGTRPVVEWIRHMPAEEQAAALGYIDLLALLGLEAHRPLVAPLEDKLWELRWKVGNKQQRIAYVAVKGRKFVLLHGITKKTPAWPRKELRVAKDRMSDYERRSR